MRSGRLPSKEQIQEELQKRSLFRPQPGPQEMFLQTQADIALYGEAAGGGKTYALLLENLRHIDNPKLCTVAPSAAMF